MKRSKIFGWTLTGLAVLFLAFDSIGKLMEIDEVVIATTNLGYPAGSVFKIGVILFISTLLYAVPKTSVIGALFLTAYLGAAVATNFRVENPLFSHILFPVYVAIVVWLSLALRNKNIFLFLLNRL